MRAPSPSLLSTPSLLSVRRVLSVLLIHNSYYLKNRQIRGSEQSEYFIPVIT